MNYGHETADPKQAIGPLECKLCGRVNYDPVKDELCPEKIIQEAVSRIKKETP